MSHKFSNKLDDISQKLTQYGVHHNLDKKVIARFWGEIEAPVRISESRIFHDFSIGAFSYLTGGFFYHTHIGRYCSLASDLHVGQGNHPIDWLSTHPFQYQRLKYVVGSGYADREIYYEDVEKADNSTVVKPIKTIIGSDVWIGYGAYIKNGVTIGDGAVIGARSVVTKDVPPYAIVVGHPARVIKYRFDEDVCQRLIKSHWWRYSPWQLRHVNFTDISKAIEQIEKMTDDGTPDYKPGIIELHR
ncbi:hypothetical protein SAMN05444339_1332 [Loktanella atrilutea]|uniref:Transferase hexapeptide (Six repeat-containing protein) n=1 Tax=Loktanella atrilutea TaxID=366533 RepID=A0A1M5G2G4_LOKAT|nr:CatB-related O-acetyltransferase [Loktanella atrilutea]SHF98017.1 hypothetical protein SAMN05444339_1332 [Loktanella atrilutea]